MKADRSPWIICPECEGEGHHSRRLGVINRDEWDDDDFENYLSGMYDARCGCCGGAGKVREKEALEYFESAPRERQIFDHCGRERWVNEAGEPL